MADLRYSWGWYELYDQFRFFILGYDWSRVPWSRRDVQLARDAGNGISRIQLWVILELFWIIELLPCFYVCCRSVSREKPLCDPPPQASCPLHWSLYNLFEDPYEGMEDDAETQRSINRSFRNLPSRSAQRSLHNASTRRRGTVTRASMRANQDVEVLNIEDYNDEEDDMASPKELAQPMSAKRRYK